jgi:hypothetical protein
VVGGNPATLGSGDTAVRSRLQTLGYVVTAVGDSASSAADASGKSVVVISSSSLSGNVGTKFRTTTVPVVTWEGGLFDDFGMTSASGVQITGQTSLAIVTAGHPLAAGLSGTVVVTGSTSDFTAGSPNANATIAARIPGATTASVFGYAAGATMPGLAAPARRVGLFLTDTTAASLTASGTALFDAAIGWAVGPGGAAASTMTLAAMDAESHQGSAPSEQRPGSPAQERPGAAAASVPEGTQLAVLQRSRKSRPLGRRRHPPS